MEPEKNRIRILCDLAEEMTTDGDHENLELLVVKTRELLGTDTCFLGEVNEKTGDIEIRAVEGIETDKFMTLKIPAGKGLGGLVSTTKEAKIIDDYFADKSINRSGGEVEKIVKDEGLKSAVAVPVQMGNKNLGVLYAFNREKTEFTEDMKRTLFIAANFAALEITRKRLIKSKEELIESKEELIQREEEFKAITEKTTDAIVQMNAKGKITSWNQAAINMFGHSESEAVGQDLHRLLAPDEFYKAFKNGFDKFKKSGEGPVVGKSKEFLAKKKDGTKFPIEVSIAAMQLKNKWWAAGIVRDLSNRKDVYNEISHLAHFDLMTGIANKDLFEETLNREWRRSIREKKHLSILIFSLVNFESFKSYYGLPKSIEVLKSISNIINSNLQRSQDLLSRHEDSTFMVLLPDANKDAAEKIKEKIQRGIKSSIGGKHTKNTTCMLDIKGACASTEPHTELMPSELIIECEKSLNKDVSKEGNGREEQPTEIPTLNLLHLSDIHVNTKDEAIQLKTTLLEDITKDIKRELDSKKIDFMIISGDITNTAEKTEYEAAYYLVDGIAKELKVDKKHIIIVPGNHDVSYGCSRDTYKFFHKCDLEKRSKVHDDKVIEVKLENMEGKFVRDDDEYKARFNNFNHHFYKKITGEDYPLDPHKQAWVYHFKEKKILFLGLNSSWQIDHFYQKRSGINRSAISEAIKELRYLEGGIDDHLKIVVCHHPVTGADGMKDTEFLELLGSVGFKVVMHGHVHKSDAQNFNPQKEYLHTIGAGTFGASESELVTARPWQYNFLTYSRKSKQILVYSRKRDGAFGPWRPEHLWKRKHYYEIDLTRQDNK